MRNYTIPHSHYQLILVATSLKFSAYYKVFSVCGVKYTSRNHTLPPHLNINYKHFTVAEHLQFLDYESFKFYLPLKTQYWQKIDHNSIITIIGAFYYPTEEYMNVGCMEHFQEKADLEGKWRTFKTKWILMLRSYGWVDLKLFYTQGKYPFIWAIHQWNEHFFMIE